MNQLSAGVPQLPCMCASFRRASRALTQLYDDALRPLGLRATQFTVLQVLARAGEVSQGALGRILAMDSTTLTRTLDILDRNGWIAKREGNDRRERRIALTQTGEAQLRRGLPRWEEAQARLRSRLGDQRWADLLTLTGEVTNVATQ
jgi:DNA-binding MarR family transcriptional regulator